MTVRYKTAPEDIVPIGQKMAFGAGNLVNNLLPGALGIFMFFFSDRFWHGPFPGWIAWRTSTDF